jgi:hypothetical protein
MTHNKNLYNQFKKDHPETVGETDLEYDTYNYCEWLEAKLTSSNSEHEKLPSCDHDWVSTPAVKCERCGLLIED